MAKVVTIQNIDKITRRKDFENAGDKLAVTSVFRTIQGEGPYAGYPSVFVRLAGCNFGDKQDHCQFCDTSFQLDRAEWLTVQELLLRCTELPGYRESDVLVVTGGEPTLQPNLMPFLNAAVDKFESLQIETNGTQAKFFQDLENGHPLLDYSLTTVVSPKASMRVERYAVPADIVRDNADVFKFVVTADEDDPHHTIPQWALDIAAYNPNRVAISPMAVYKRPYSGEVSSAWDHDLIDAQETSKNYAYAAEYALKHGLRLSIQQHLFLGVA